MDDNTTNQKVGRLMLENLGCRVDTAANGKEAVEMLELLPYDTVFMDCEMPEMDGYEATAEIRRRMTGQQRIPIIAMTAKAIQGDRERCLDSGMDDYITKPVRLEDIEAALERWIPKNKPAVVNAVGTHPTAFPSGSSGKVRDAVKCIATAGRPALDPEVTQRLRDLAAATDPSVLAEIYEAFLTSTDGYLANLRQAAQAGNCDGLAKAAHALKGASANIGAKDMAAMAGQLESSGGESATVGAEELIDRLEQEFERVRLEIK